VRLRMALVPGLLGSSAGGGSSSSGGDGGSDGGLLAATASTEVSHMLSFFHKSLLGSSRDSVLVEVRLCGMCLCAFVRLVQCMGGQAGSGWAGGLLVIGVSM